MMKFKTLGYIGKQKLEIQHRNSMLA